MTRKFISHFPRPLLDDLVDGRWFPIVGAGMSRNAIVPSGCSLPLWDDLGKALADDLVDYPYSGAMDAISAFEHEYGRPKLVERLSGLLLTAEAQPGEAHRAFCEIPFNIVCTTNFDFLLERQYEATPRYCRPVIDENQLSVNLQSAAVMLLKLHGDLHHPDRLVVTESDFDEFLAKYPLLATYLANKLINRTAVLIGYSLDDPDFRQVWQVIGNRLGKSRRVAYALTVEARSADIARFERRGVKVINLPGKRTNYSTILATTFGELRDYVLENVIPASHVTEEAPLRELSMPLGSTTRLCFVAVPIELQPFYREHVFPVIRETGFVPVTADSVLSPGDTIAAKVDALITRASVVLVEASSPWTLSELRMSIAQLEKRETGNLMSAPKPQIIPVSTDPNRVPIEHRGLAYILRQDTLKDDPEPFLGRLRDRFLSIARQITPAISEEPLRLLEAREYRAAVIAAATLLESVLRRSLERAPVAYPQRALSLRRLVDLATRQNLLPENYEGRIMSWIVVRNEVVHSEARVTAGKAKEIVNGVIDIVRQLELPRG